MSFTEGTDTLNFRGLSSYKSITGMQTSGNKEEAYIQHSEGEWVNVQFLRSIQPRAQQLVLWHSEGG